MNKKAFVTLGLTNIEWEPLPIDNKDKKITYTVYYGKVLDWPNCIVAFRVEHKKKFELKHTTYDIYAQICKIDNSKDPIVVYIESPGGRNFLDPGSIRTYAA